VVSHLKAKKKIKMIFCCYHVQISLTMSQNVTKCIVVSDYMVKMHVV